MFFELTAVHKFKEFNMGLSTDFFGWLLYQLLLLQEFRPLVSDLFTEAREVEFARGCPPQHGVGGENKLILRVFCGGRSCRS